MTNKNVFLFSVYNSRYSRNAEKWKIVTFAFFYIALNVIGFVGELSQYAPIFCRMEQCSSYCDDQAYIFDLEKSKFISA